MDKLMGGTTSTNKTILITGCSSGIGLHCAKRLLEDGWQVVATARKKSDLAMLADMGVHPVYMDYAKSASIKSAFEKTLILSGGRLDALFNNGAYGQAGAVEDVSVRALRQQFDANFFGWHELTNLVVPVMRRQGGGRIIHCSSVLGLVPSPWRGAYNASKFALEGLASTMRLELFGSGIHVCLIEPGPIVSKFGQNGLAHFTSKIDIENSCHAAEYQRQLNRLSSSGGVNRFRLGPEAVYKSLRHALETRHPRAHYHVTLPTRFMALARRFFPQTLVDLILRRSG
jgi:NAD(P)-dependent dehydrogenase (short-subunit alcohol dehydrogenase family)